jgi:hypothetical protein
MRLDKRGYARVTVSENGEKRPVFAHRLSWVFHRGPIPPGMVICHRCDTPACINPDHLFVGTQSDNIRDCMRKGRKWPVHGDYNGHAKITDVDALAIMADNRTHTAIAEAYGLHQSTVSRIKAGLRRPHVWRQANA